MTNESGVIYEVSLDIEPDIIGEFDITLALLGLTRASELGEQNLSGQRLA